MKKSIYEVCVEMNDQEQCDRMKQLCLDNGLPMKEYLFKFAEHIKFIYAPKAKIFAVYFGELSNRNNLKVTEEEFIELLKTHKNE